MPTKKELIVWGVCETLHKNSLNPTIKLVGDELIKNGNARGSNRDIAQYIRSWRNKNQLPLAMTEVPANFSEHFNQLAVKLEQILAMMGGEISSLPNTAARSEQDETALIKHNIELRTKLNAQAEEIKKCHATILTQDRKLMSILQKERALLELLGSIRREMAELM